MIFGSGSAKFTSASVTVDLEYSVLVPNFIESETIQHVSVIDGARNYITLGDYSSFKVDVYLFKYANPRDKFLEIYDYIHTDVNFFPHSDGKTMYGNDGAIMQCHITDMKLSYLDNKDYRDLLTISFETKGYTNAVSSSIG